MALNIEKMRADMAWETRKFVIQIVVAAVAIAGAAGALGWIGGRGQQQINVHLDAPLVVQPR